MIRGVNLNSVEYRSERLYAYENYVSLVPAGVILVTASNPEHLIAAHVTDSVCVVKTGKNVLLPK